MAAPGNAGVIASTSIVAPSDGFVEVQVTGHWRNLGAATDEVWCQLQKGTAGAIDTTQPWFLLSDRNTGAAYTSFSAHRVLSIAVADNPILFGFGQSLSLVCDLVSGTAEFDDVHISATFFATSYEPNPIIIFP